MNSEEIKKYLDDLDNLIDTGHFSTHPVTDYVFYHKDLSLKNFIDKGREIIRQHLISIK